MALCISLLIHSVKAHTCLMFHYHTSRTAVSDTPSEKVTVWGHQFRSCLTSKAVLTQLLRCKLCKPSTLTLFLKQLFEQTTFKKPFISSSLSLGRSIAPHRALTDNRGKRAAVALEWMSETVCGFKVPFFQSNGHLKNLRLSRKLCCFGLCPPST